MKKSVLLFVVLFLMSGCAFLNERKADWEACKVDAACMEQAKSWQSKTETVSLIAASAVPVPGAAAAPKILGYAAFAVAMLIGGHALKKKKEVVGG